MLIMSEVEIYHAKFGHAGMKNKEVMTVLVIWGGGRGERGGKCYGRIFLRVGN